ncbi:MAG TPA: DUF6085 family protein, partial [Mycobacteriales bacterium]|nr:DUF6085 family protein [Mycobacteriales bacterium]
MPDPTTIRHGLGTDFPFVAAYCPACGRYGLFLGAGGHVTCPQQDCPNPGAASEILDDGETEHIVK